MCLKEYGDMVVVNKNVFSKRQKPELPTAPVETPAPQEQASIDSCVVSLKQAYPGRLRDRSPFSKGNILDKTDAFGKVLETVRDPAPDSLGSEEVTQLRRAAKSVPALGTLVDKMIASSGVQVKRGIFKSPPPPRSGYSTEKKLFWSDQVLFQMLKTYDQPVLQDGTDLVRAWQRDYSTFHQRMLALLLVPKSERLKLIRPLVQTLSNSLAGSSRNEKQPNAMFIPWLWQHDQESKTLMPEEYQQFMLGMASNRVFSFESIWDALSWPQQANLQLPDTFWRELATCLGRNHLQGKNLQRHPRLISSLPTQEARAELGKWSQAALQIGI